MGVDFTPVVAPLPERALSLPGFLRAVRTNAIGMWPRAAYEQPTLRQAFLGRPLVLLNAPEAIQHVLVANAANYRRSPASIRVLRPVAGDGLLMSEGEAWRHQRRTIAPALGPRALPMLCRHVARCADDAARQLARDTRLGGPVDLLTTMQNLALDIAGRSMFSLDIGPRGPAIRAMLMEFAERHARPGLLDMLLPPTVTAPGDFGRRRFQRRWMALIDDVIAERLAEPPPNDTEARDLLDLLRAARDPETGATFDRPQLRDQAATLLLAGHETTAITLFWVFYLLAHTPDWQLRIAEETERADLSPETASAALATLPATRAVVDEALRLYPPAFTIVRQARADDVADGVPIPRGAVAMVAPWVLHRHRALWDRPDAFDPSRFLPPAPTPPRFAYLPFGAGPRVCVGAQFALAEAVLVTARLLRSFSVALDNPDGRPALPAAVVTTQPDHAPTFRLTPRA